MRQKSLTSDEIVALLENSGDELDDDESDDEYTPIDDDSESDSSDLDDIDDLSDNQNLPNYSGLLSINIFFDITFWHKL